MPTATTQRLSQEQAIAALSQRMLQGWTMLADTCPIPECYTPLISKQGEPMFCVRCQLPVVTEAQAAASGVAPAQPLPGSSQQGQQSADAASAATAAAPAPMATLPEAGVSNWEPPSAEEEAAMAERRKHSDAVSARIGQRLLQGWTLLADSCPADKCQGAPLVRNRQREMWCVSCDRRVMSEEEAAADAATGDSDAAAATSTPAPATSSQRSEAVMEKTVPAVTLASAGVSPSPSRGTSFTRSSPVPRRRRVEATPSMSANDAVSTARSAGPSAAVDGAVAATTSSSTRAVLAAPCGDDDPALSASQVLFGTQSALLDKLSRMQAALVDSGDLTEIDALARVIGTAVVALDRVHAALANLS